MARFCPLGDSNTLNPAFGQGYANFQKYSKTDRHSLWKMVVYFRELVTPP